MTRPAPPQRAQGATVANEPRMVFWTWRTWPEPEQAEQVCGALPALEPLPWQVPHASIRERRRDLGMPDAASSIVISRS